MDASTIDAVDNFINDASDQAAAWYSILNDKPVVVPTAQITAQTALATSGGSRVQTTADGSQFVPATADASLMGGVSVSSLVIVLALAVVAWFVVEG